MDRAIQRTTADKEAYEHARLDRVFNLHYRHQFPRSILRATSSEDILAAVHHAAHRGFRVSLRSGGHSMFAWSLVEDSILIDLGKWKEMTVDTVSKVVSVTPSVTCKELNNYLRGHGLFVPSGHFPDVGLGGFLLQGGQGWNCRNWGWASDQLVAVEVVTARGEQILCNDQCNQDLFWAARGSGPLFPGIVTRFHLQTRHYPWSILASAYIYPASHYRVVFDWVQALIPDSDKDTEAVMVAFYSTERREVCFKVHFVTMKTSTSEARHALHQMDRQRPSGSIMEMVCQESALDDLYKDQSMANPESHYYHVDSRFIKNTADITSVLEGAFSSLPSDKSFAFWYPMYPRSRQDRHDMVLSVPSDHYFAIYSISQDPTEAEQGTAFVTRTMAKITEHAVGSYVGDNDLKMGKEWYWTEAKARRLQEIRRKWDPNKLFCEPHLGDS